MKIRNIITLLVCGAGALSNAQTATENYATETIYKEGRNATGTYTPNAGDFVTITYYDGLGRPVQKIEKNANAQGTANLVTPIEYEKNVGQLRTYLPFVSNNNSSDYIADALQAAYNYHNTTSGTSNPYSENRLEASPNARVLETGAPGFYWDINFENGSASEDNRHTIRYSYGFNRMSEVKKFDVTNSWDTSRELYTASVSQNGSYPAGSLKKTITKNENWKAADGKNNTIEEFTGTDGKVVLKRTYNNSIAHDTYYVYDFYGNLAFVIPPLADGSVAGDNIDKLCYQYLYDEKNRLVEKKLPQKGWEFIVYDKADRIVMTGPANNPLDAAAAPGWIATKYDQMGRVLYTGFYNGHTATSANRKAIKNTIYAQADNNEAKSTAGNTIDGVATRYTNSKFPTTLNLLTVNYYDDYAFPGAPATLPAVQGVAPLAKVKGLATGSWTRVLTTAAERKANLSYTLYNNKYQPVRTYTANYLGGYIQTDHMLTFRGVPTKTITTQKKDAATALLTVTDNYTYDHLERLKTHTQQINGGTVETIASNEYDDLGKLITKNVGGATGNLQKVDYQYNIRGWLTDVNNLSTSNNIDDDLFQLKIDYEQELSGWGVTTTPLYNGNISSVYSRTKVNNLIRGYEYNYDEMNRLLEGNVLFYAPGGWRIGWTYLEQYNERMSYDKNGNILTMNRTGENVDGQTIEIDELAYTYTGNQLQSVTDATNNAEGFADGNPSAGSGQADYFYDSFGNLTQDKNKGITNIAYNHLNLPTEK